MSFIQQPKVKIFSKTTLSSQLNEESRKSLLINSSKNVTSQQKPLKSEITIEVLRKLSDMIVELHSSLVPKIQNFEIERNLTEEEQTLLNLVKSNNVVYTITSGILAIDYCLKYISRQQNYVINNLMKAVTILLVNYKKIEEQLILSNNNKISGNFLKFSDSIKLIISQIHKIPAAKIKSIDIQKHIQLLKNAQIKNIIENFNLKEDNMFFQKLFQQNQELRSRIDYLQKRIRWFQQQNDKISFQTYTDNLEPGKRQKTQYFTRKQQKRQSSGISSLSQEIHQKQKLILKMNQDFANELLKYQKVFNKLEEQNRLLKKYNDLDTVYILEELQYEVQKLRKQKRNDQNIIDQIMKKMDRMSWNNVQNFKSSVQPQSYPRSRFNTMLDNNEIYDSRIFRKKLSRNPSSISPTNKPSILKDRYFSPDFSGIHKNYMTSSRKVSKNKRSYSPKFGNCNECKNQERTQRRISRQKLRQRLVSPQLEIPETSYPFSYNESPLKISRLKNMRYSLNNNEILLPKNPYQVRRSKFLN